MQTKINIRLRTNGQWQVSFRGMVLGQSPSFTRGIDLLLEWLRENVREDVSLAIETVEGHIDQYRYHAATGQVIPVSALAA